MTTAVQSRRVSHSDIPLRTGRLDFYDGRYGFIVPENDVGDIFLRWTVVKSCKILPDQLTPGRRVKYRAEEGLKGPNKQAVYIELA